MPAQTDYFVLRADGSNGPQFAGAGTQPKVKTTAAAAPAPVRGVDEGTITRTSVSGRDVHMLTDSLGHRPRIQSKESFQVISQHKNTM